MTFLTQNPQFSSYAGLELMELIERYIYIYIFFLKAFGLIVVKRAIRIWIFCALHI